MAVPTALLLLALIISSASSPASASDPAPLQDFCVADLNSPVKVNGFCCKNPALATAADFFLAGLNVPGNITAQGSAVNPAFVTQIPGLNTLGIALARLHFAPYGLLPPHIHPRATEIMTVIEGTLFAGFVTSAPDFRFIHKVLQAGDVFVFPVGLIHFQLNLGNTPAIAISGLSNQNPKLNLVGNSIFGSKPKILDEVLAKSFMVDKQIIDIIQSKF